MRRQARIQAALVATLLVGSGVRLGAGQRWNDVAPRPASIAREVSGKVMAVDLRSQSIVIASSGGDRTAATSSIAFSRWTRFYSEPGSAMVESVAVDSNDRIEPEDLPTGVRVCVMLDPNDAVAESVVVLPPVIQAKNH